VNKHEDKKENGEELIYNQNFYWIWAGEYYEK